MSFPYIRTRRSPSFKKKGPNRPPPLKLHATFLHAQDKQKMQLKQRSGRYDRVKAQAVRGSISGPSDNKEQELEVPLKMEIGMSDSEPSAEGEPLVNPMQLEKLAMEHSKTTDAEPRGTFSGEIHHTIVNLNKDSDSSDISPISEDRPAVRFSSALRRFFPELSTNVDLISPTSTDRMMQQMEQTTCLETELKRRVQSLWRSQSGEDREDYSFEGKTSSSSGSDGIFDGASSCYSRRSSLSSIGTDGLGEKGVHHWCADAYSIISPAAAGVFDDAASICPSRASSVKSSLSVPSLRARSARASPTTSSYPTRCNSAVSLNTTKTSSTMHDPKNKPLPLEPVSEADIAPSPLAVRRHNTRMNMHQQPNAIYTRSAYSQSSPSASHLAVQSPYTTTRSPSGASSPGYHACHTCGGHSPRPRKTHRSQWAEHLEKGEPHIRQLPSLSQAAEELEDVLADLQRQGSKQRTLLILDGPLQVSRHNGDLIATRPAPLPPSTKPHSTMYPSEEPLRSSKSIKPSKSGKSTRSEKENGKPTRSAKVQRDSRPIHLAAIPESDSQSQTNKDKSHQKSKSVDESIVLKGTEKSKEAGSLSNTSYKDEEFKKDKSLKKSFTFSMKSFKRNKPVSVRSTSTPLVPSSLSPSSDASLDPPDQPLQSKSSSDTSLAVEDSAQAKRDSLLLQLPRLQTNNLELASLYDRVHAAVKGVTRSTSGSPQSSPTNPASFKGEEEEVQVQAREDEDLPRTSEEKIVVEPAMKAPERTRHMHAFVSTAQASSVQLPANQVYELDAAPPSPTSTLPAFDVRKPIEANITLPPDFPVRLTMNIMEQIDSLDDLFNLVLVNKRFYGIFKKHELHMIKSALFKMSPPAWELREMSPPWATETQLLEPDARVPDYTPSLYLDRYAQDIYTLARLKSMILVRCSSFLRRDTVRGLSGQDIKRAEEVDDAFWRIWTFCRIFGSNKGRENDIEGQVDWLRGGVRARGLTGASGSMTEPFGMSNVLFEPPEGFGRGNGAGLSPKQLYDMTEIWTCMGVLLQPLHGKCIEARRVGIYDGMDVPANDPGREERILGKFDICLKNAQISCTNLANRGMDILCSHHWPVCRFRVEFYRPS